MHPCQSASVHYLPERLRHHRQRAGLTQSQLADLSYVSLRTIARIEGGYEPKPSTVRLLAIALGVDEAVLAEPNGDEEAA